MEGDNCLKNSSFPVGGPSGLRGAAQGPSTSGQTSPEAQRRCVLTAHCEPTSSTPNIAYLMALSPPPWGGGTESPPCSKDGYGLWDQEAFWWVEPQGTISEPPTHCFPELPQGVSGSCGGRAAWASGGIIFLLPLGSPSPMFGAVVFWMQRKHP